MFYLLTRWEYEERRLPRNDAQICKEEASAVRPKKRWQLMREPRPPDMERNDGTPVYPRESAAQKRAAYSMLCASLIDDWCRGRKSKVKGKGLWSINPKYSIVPAAFAMHVVVALASIFFISLS